MRIRPLRHITEDMTISILPTVPIGLMQKKSGYFYKARNCGTQQIRRLYLTKKKTCELGFLETVKITVRIIQLQNVSIPQKTEMSQLNKKGQ